MEGECKSSDEMALKNAAFAWEEINSTDKFFFLDNLQVFFFLF